MRHVARCLQSVRDENRHRPLAGRAPPQASRQAGPQAESGIGSAQDWDLSI